MVIFYEHNTLLAVELHLVGDQAELGSFGQSVLTVVPQQCAEDRVC
jgi:hypothetical protein